MDDAHIQKRKTERIEHINLPQEEQTIYDLSATGISVFSQESLAPGSRVTFSLNELSLPARVVYSTSHANGYRLGMQFVDMDAATRSAVKELVDKYAKGVPVRYSFSVSDHS
jgi:hypothetical protein